jgi:hypothetical protein
VTEQLLETGSNAQPEMAGSSARNGHEEGAVIALEPSEPTRRVMVRLRRALVARAAIRHPNLLPARFLGAGDGRLFVAFAPAARRSLSELLAAGPLEPGKAALLVVGAAAGVDVLGQSGLVSHDLTTDRVIVDPARGAVLMDLGIPPQLLRQVPPEQDPNLPFRSPEEVAGKPADVRSSVYSLGVVLFTALTGDPPRPSERQSELPRDLASVVSRAMAADPAERYPDVKALSRALTAAAGLPPEVTQIPAHSNGHPPKPRFERTDEKRRSPEPRSKRRSAQERRTESRASSRSANGFGARCVAGVRRCVALVAACLTLAGAAGRRGSSWLRRLAKSVVPAPRSAAGLVGTGAVVAGVASRRARGTLRRPRRLALPAAAAILASALSGLALGRAVEPEEGAPASVTRSGLTVQLPPGWQPARVDPGRLALSSAVAAAPSDGARAGFVVGKPSSQAAAERILERSHRGGGERAQVRLGGAYAWRYAGLRLRPNLVGVGYLVPVTGGAVVMLCHSSPAEAAARLAECGRAATTLVVRGARPHRTPLVDRVAARLTAVIATLRASRSDALRRLAAADRPFGQARAATSLERIHERAAEALDQTSGPEATRSLAGLAAALSTAADAYGRLGHAAETGSRSAYRTARSSVARDEKAVRRELQRVA